MFESLGVMLSSIRVETVSKEGYSVPLIQGNTNNPIC